MPQHLGFPAFRINQPLNERKTKHVSDFGVFFGQCLNAGKEWLLFIENGLPFIKQHYLHLKIEYSIMHQKSPPSMRHTPQKFEVLEGDPFKNDVFERKSQVEKLTKLVQSCTEESFVLAINGVWGSGKSVFLDMWGAYLKQLGFQTLRFNAWENDYSEDPFASVFSEFRKLAEASEKEDERSQLADLYQRAKKMAVPILAKTMGSVVKHATMGMLNINQDAESILGNLAEASAQHALDKAESGKKASTPSRENLVHLWKRLGLQTNR